MNIEFKSLAEVEKLAVINLMNITLVRRQMPLLKGNFTEEDYNRFIVSKEEMWNKHGFGPWAFIIDKQFAGWGGIQPGYDGEAELALVLHPDYWGVGKVLYKIIQDKAFNELGLSSIQVLFPTTRTRVKGLLRLGFIKDSLVEIENKQFRKYVLKKQKEHT